MIKKNEIERCSGVNEAGTETSHCLLEY
jgi:hypothetical protein